jgi:hypothetical protein
MSLAKSLTKGIKGAWLLHHDQKLLNVRTTEFESIVTAGRSARLLSIISREIENTVTRERVIELARGIGIRKIEVDAFLSVLAEHGLIDNSDSGVAVLGVSQASLLDHASDIFEAQTPSGTDRAVVALSEIASSTPVRRSDCAEQISDEYKLSEAELEDVFLHAEHIGFIDYEQDGEERLYFNGSLFKRNSAAKSRLIIENLSPQEKKLLLEVEGALSARGCLLADQLRRQLGDKLWSKLHQIGFFEVSVVVNEHGVTEFVTKPEALAKYVPGGLADMLDDAKALASSLTYGIIKSPEYRGRIKDPSLLISTLISRGYVEGRAAAIKQDYHVLERRGVVQVTSTDGGNRLTLLKQEIGKMARDLILRGDASATAAEFVATGHAPQFIGPEGSRMTERKKDVPEAKVAASRSLNILRKAK